MNVRQQVKDLFRLLVINFEDANFLKLIGRIEHLLSKILAIALVVVTFIIVFELLWILTYDLVVTDPKGAFSVPILKIFGMFLNILIALELMENITAYLRQNFIQLELVIITALTAVARKIVIFDSKTDGDITGFAIAILALSISYWIVRNQKQSSNH